MPLGSHGSQGCCGVVPGLTRLVDGRGNQAGHGVLGMGA